ncbi:MAG: hypothetical protein KatS3mg087_2016 [Patescibacteria group bacterium]|nr:MAG: hypothetical protein KatS3mg087_2016 [Patescibacteria group bacterium]
MAVIITLPSSMISLHLSRDRVRSLLALGLAVAYGTFLAVLPLEVFKDRYNYLTYASVAPLILEQRMAEGLLPLLSNEPVWLLLNSLLGMVFSPETVVRLLIFLPATVIAWLTLRNHKGWMGWVLIFLFFPAVIKNYIIHLRQGVAIAFFLCGWYALRPSWRGVTWFITPFIHASFFFVLLVYGMVHVAKRLHLAIDLRSVIILGVAIGITLCLPSIVAGVGARQSFEYNLLETEVTGLGFLFWLFIFAIFVCQNRQFLQHHAFEVATVIFYLGMYFWGAISARVFESTLILVLLSGLSLTKHWRFVFLAMISSFMFLDYYLRISESWLGWGV